MILACLAAPAGARAAPTADARLTYRGFVAGAPVGEATVTVAVVDGRYRVAGDARSNGVLIVFGNWRNRFSAEGRLQGTERHPEAFAYTESDRSKTRRVVVSDGELRVTKNGKLRPTRTAPAFPDLISALFVQPRCDDGQILHTGRHVYRLNRIEHEAASCRFTVIDDDDDSFELDLFLVRHDDLLVPQKIIVRGWLTGWIELMETSAPSRPAQAR